MHSEVPKLPINPNILKFPDLTSAHRYVENYNPDTIPSSEKITEYCVKINDIFREEHESVSSSKRTMLVLDKHYNGDKVGCADLPKIDGTYTLSINIIGADASEAYISINSDESGRFSKLLLIKEGNSNSVELNNVTTTTNAEKILTKVLDVLENGQKY